MSLKRLKCVFVNILSSPVWRIYTQELGLLSLIELEKKNLEIKLI